MICFQGCEKRSVKPHTVLPSPSRWWLVDGGCRSGSPATSWPLGPTACCWCQTVGRGSAPHPGRLCPRSAARQWPPGETCSSVRCRPSATTPLPAELEEGATWCRREVQGMLFSGVPTLVPGDPQEQPPWLLRLVCSGVSHKSRALGPRKETPVSTGNSHSGHRALGNSMFLPLVQ